MPENLNLSTLTALNIGRRLADSIDNGAGEFSGISYSGDGFTYSLDEQSRINEIFADPTDREAVLAYIDVLLKRSEKENDEFFNETVLPSLVKVQASSAEQQSGIDLAALLESAQYLFLLAAFLKVKYSSEHGINIEFPNNELLKEIIKRFGFSGD